jgi:ribokinase
MTRQNNGVTVLGSFVADLAFRAGRIPRIGETLTGSGFAMGPGGKGSNQAVAAARAGAKVTFVSKIGDDVFGEMALGTWSREGIVARVSQTSDAPTGAAFIYVNDQTGENAIIVVPGAAASISVGDVEASGDAIRSAAVFVTQLEQPAAAARRGLEIARSAGVATVFNPAPAESFEDALYALTDYITPNETEAAALTGVAITSIDDARRAADVLLAKRVGAALITLGDKGALFHSRGCSVEVPAFDAGPVVETAGAGDAFNGGFAAALARGMEPIAAARFGSAVAGISVTRPGTAPSMPSFAEVERLMAEFRAGE